MAAEAIVGEDGQPPGGGAAPPDVGAATPASFDDMFAKVPYIARRPSDIMTLPQALDWHYNIIVMNMDKSDFIKEFVLSKLPRVAYTGESPTAQDLRNWADTKKRTVDSLLDSFAFLRHPNPNITVEKLKTWFKLDNKSAQVTAANWNMDLIDNDYNIAFKQWKKFEQLYNFLEFVEGDGDEEVSNMFDLYYNNHNSIRTNTIDMFNAIWNGAVIPFKTDDKFAKIFSSAIVVGSDAETLPEIKYFADDEMSQGELVLCMLNDEIPDHFKVDMLRRLVLIHWNNFEECPEVLNLTTCDAVAMYLDGVADRSPNAVMYLKAFYADISLEQKIDNRATLIDIVIPSALWRFIESKVRFVCIQEEEAAVEAAVEETVGPVEPEPEESKNKREESFQTCMAINIILLQPRFCKLLARDFTLPVNFRLLFQNKNNLNLDSTNCVFCELANVPKVYDFLFKTEHNSLGFDKLLTGIIMEDTYGGFFKCCAFTFYSVFRPNVIEYDAFRFVVLLMSGWFRNETIFDELKTASFSTKLFNGDFDQIQSAVQDSVSHSTISYYDCYRYIHFDDFMTFCPYIQSLGLGFERDRCIKDADYEKMTDAFKFVHRYSPSTGSQVYLAYSVALRDSISSGIEKINAKQYQGAIEVLYSAQEYIKILTHSNSLNTIDGAASSDLIEECTKATTTLLKLAQNKIGDATKSAGSEKGNELKQRLEASVVSDSPNLPFSEIAGLETAKELLKEAVIIPINFPQLFTGKRKPWTGILMYGPPGTGKSYLAKALATEAKNSTFISVGAADLGGKYQGESEGLVKALYQIARERAPSIVFVDEIESIGSKRTDDQSETAAKVKTQFLVEMDGLGGSTSGILTLGATNLPWKLDEALIRRFQRRIYIRLPDKDARAKMIAIHIGTTPNTLTQDDLDILSGQMDNFSSSDVSTMVKSALNLPVRELLASSYFLQKPVGDKTMWVPCSQSTPGAVQTQLAQLPPKEVAAPSLTLEHMQQALSNTSSSIVEKTLKKYADYTAQYGSG